MNMDIARQMLEEAKESGLRLHGISAGGLPAISFDQEQPGAEMARRRFQGTQGLVRELLRAAMIDECIRLGLPENLSPSFEFSLEHDFPAAETNQVLH